MWLTLIVAETISAHVGHRLHDEERARVPADDVVLVILVYAVLGKLADSIARMLERWWHPAGTRAVMCGRQALRCSQPGPHATAGKSRRCCPRRECGDVRGRGAEHAWGCGASAATSAIAACSKGFDLEIAPCSFVSIVGRSGEGQEHAPAHACGARRGGWRQHHPRRDAAARYLARCHHHVSGRAAAAVADGAGQCRRCARPGLGAPSAAQALRRRSASRIARANGRSGQLSWRPEERVALARAWCAVRACCCSTSHWGRSMR